MSRGNYIAFVALSVDSESTGHYGVSAGDVGVRLSGIFIIHRSPFTPSVFSSGVEGRRTFWA